MGGGRGILRNLPSSHLTVGAPESPVRLPGLRHVHHGRHRQAVQRQLARGPYLAQRGPVVGEQLRGPLRRWHVPLALHEHHPEPSLVSELEPALSRQRVPLEEQYAVVSGLRKKRHNPVVVSNSPVLPTPLLQDLPDVAKTPPRQPFPYHLASPLLRVGSTRAPLVPYGYILGTRAARLPC